MLKLFGAACAVALLLFVTARPGPVQAHADYDKSEPPADGVVKTAPTMVMVWFTEGVKKKGTELAVKDASGKKVDKGDTTLVSSDPDHKQVMVSLLPNLPAGKYTVEWKSVSDDDNDEDSGDFAFTINPNASASTSSTTGVAPAAAAAPTTAPVAQAAPTTTPTLAPRPTASPAPAVAQAPCSLPRTGEAEPWLPFGLVALAVGLALAGAVVRWNLPPR
jgi:methionine-rich copper-binding protein CopC